jgi:diguanylate cyclase (GGDEF)-like protein
VPEGSAERLLQRWRPYDARRLTRRELRIEGLAATAFVAVAVVLPLVLDSSRDFDPLLAAALTVSLALASRVHLYVGAGSAVPTQLVLVPMLFLLPPATVPACVAAGLLLADAADVARRREHPERLVASAADAWNAVGPALVFAAAGSPAAGLDDWGVLALALAAQCLTDLLAATAREWLGRGIAPAMQLRVLGAVYLIDASLTPVGLAIAMACAGRPYAFLLGLPLLALLSALAADRGRRIREAVGRLDELTAEHERLDRAIDRIGEAFASKLDRDALADIVVRTAVETLGAQYGRATLASGTVEHGTVAGPSPADAEDAARRAGTLRVVAGDEFVAMAQPLTGGRWAASTEVLSIARRDVPFTADEQARFSLLARQTAVALENVALHDQLRRQATVDELTGLSNHRRFHEALAHEVVRMRRSGRPTALALIDVDDFKSMNDSYGHRLGDSVLELVADVIGDACRATDEPARYGGDELAVILAETDLDGAHTIADNLRRAVEGAVLPHPDGTTTRVTISIGVGAMAPGAGDPAALIEAADVGLYAAKRTGKNRVLSGGWAAGRPDDAAEKRFASTGAASEQTPGKRV